MNRLLIILAAISCLCSCGNDNILLTDEPFPETKETEDSHKKDDPDDPDKVDWAAAIDYVFDESVIPEIHISISQEQWDSLLTYYDRNPDTQEFVVCDVEYRKGDEVTSIEEAGLRLKGNKSRRRPFENGKYRHVHFGVNFHKYHHDPDHTIKGLRRVDLKWFKDDPTYAREIYCYDLFHRSGIWTAVHDVYARLWIKVGEQEIYYGVYELMEHIDKNYIQPRLEKFGSKKGDLWKCIGDADLSNENKSMGLDDNLTKFRYELKDSSEERFPEAKARLQDFIRHLVNLDGAAFDEWIATHMDVDFLLKTYAVNVAVGMWDDYWNNKNNYYLYFSPVEGGDYKVWFIPYDYDCSLGTSLVRGVQTDPGRQDPFNWGLDSAPLLVKILKNNDWREKYKQYLQQLCSENGDFYYRKSIDRIRAWQNTIRSFVPNDTNQDMTISDKPASWGNHSEYRLVTNSKNNFFKVKAETVNAM